jgi:hypothetical protein
MRTLRLTRDSEVAMELQVCYLFGSEDFEELVSRDYVADRRNEGFGERYALRVGQKLSFSKEDTGDAAL